MCHCTFLSAWLRMLAHASNWHKTEARLFIVMRLSSVKLMHFRMRNEKVAVMTAMFSVVSVFRQFLYANCAKLRR